MLSLVPCHRTCTRALTFQNVCHTPQDATSAFSALVQELDDEGAAKVRELALEACSLGEGGVDGLFQLEARNSTF